VLDGVTRTVSNVASLNCFSGKGLNVSTSSMILSRRMKLLRISGIVNSHFGVS
jgi:hypothetical protein